jgi:hypothetical protein
MWRQALAGALIAAWLPAAAAARNTEPVTVRVLVPTFGGPTGLGANAATILALRIWTTFRPRPDPNPQNLNFGRGQFMWSRRVIDDSPEEANRAAVETQSDMALWGSAAEYGSGVVVTANLVIPTTTEPQRTRQLWTVAHRSAKLALGLPNSSYQFAPLVMRSEVVASYSRPNRIRVCAEKVAECDGPPLGSLFRELRVSGDFVRVRLANNTVGWVALPNLAETQGEVIDFVAALVSYLRGDLEQAERYLDRVRQSQADAVVRLDAALLAGICRYRRGLGTDLLRAVHTENPYSRYAVQALAMADIDAALRERRGAERTARVKEANDLVASYRHLFAPGDPWLRAADSLLRSLK